MQLFDDRKEAGGKLAARLAAFAGRDDVVVLALPRGGVPVAFEVAQALRVPLDVLIVRKLGTPGQEELAMGAIASGGVRVLNQDVIRALGISEPEIERVAAKERVELERRESAYRAGRAALEVAGRTVILIDDGVATGATMKAAVAALRARKPERVVVAVPTAARDSRDALAKQADEVICLATPEPYIAVGVWYRSFGQTSDEEVRVLLAHSAGPATAGGPQH